MYSELGLCFNDVVIIIKVFSGCAIVVVLVIRVH